MKRNTWLFWLVLLQTSLLPTLPRAQSSDSDISSLFSNPGLATPCLPSSSKPASLPSRCMDVHQSFLPLSPLDDARTLIVGYHPDAEDFIADLARALTEESTLREQHLLVLIPQGQLERTRRILTSKPELKLLHRQQRLDLRSTRDSNNTWMQDAFELGWEPFSQQPKILDLPHFESDRAAQSLSASCGLPRLDPEPGLETPGLNWSEASKGDSRNHGGNWEAFPGGILATLREPDLRLRGTFEKNSPELEILALNIDWLEVGHIDEVFSVIPRPDTPGPASCQFAILAASPGRAIEALSSSHQDSPIEPELSHAHPKVNQAPEMELGCISRLADARTGRPLRSREARACRKLIQVNREYQTLIERQLAILLERVEQKTGCTDIPVLQLPILFRPAHRMSNESWEKAQTLKVPPTSRWRQASAINPNPINGISLNETQVVPAQPHPAFKAAIQAEFESKSNGTRLRWIDTPHVHFLGGEAHCGTNVIRTCTSGN